MNRALLFQKFVKYNILDQFLINNPSSNILTKTPVDIYIDVQSIYKNVLAETLLVNDVKVLSVNILNLAAHYRHYFKSRYNVNTRIFIVNTLSSINNIFENINAKNEDMFIILKKISLYFPLVYFIERNVYNSASVIFSLIKSETLPVKHSALIISNSIYSYQIPAFIPSSFVIRPSINTKFITFNNVIDIMYPRKGSTVTSDINPGLIPVIMAYHKCPELGMEMINNFKRTITIIREKISKGQLLNGYNSPVIFQKTESENMFRRLCISDLITYTKVYENSYESLVKSWRVYKQCDYNNLANVLDKTFNVDEENILNYLFLLEVDELFVRAMNSN